ncbi:MAG: putative toxin-antitoxin system toxin component, PIN family [Ginsengibacter sp.]
MKVVIDCNIMVMCLSSRSTYHNIYQSLLNGYFNLALSSEILLEYEEIIQKKYSVATANAFVALLRELPNVQFYTPSFKWLLIANDPEDDKYSDCAITGGADFLVTEDKHFAILKTITFPRIKVLSIEDFSQLIKEK